MRKLALVLVLALPGTIVAQTFSLITGREAVTSLDGLWRFHTGDNPEWADSGFDDSDWPLLRSDESWTAQGYPAFNGYAWYRFRIEVPGDGRSVGLLLTEIVNGYEVFADGKLIGSAGSAVATRDPVFSGRPMLLPLPMASGGPRSIQIALRVWSYKPIAFWIGAGPRGKSNQAGDPALLSSQLRNYRSNNALHFVSEYAYGLFAGLIGLAILALFLLHPADKEYLWFSILLLAQSADVALHLMLNLGSLPMPLWDLLRLIAEASSLLAAMAFFSIVLGARRSLLWWIICLLVAITPLTTALIYFQWTGMGVSLAIAQACILPAYLWVIGKLLLGALRKDVSARLLLAPVTLSYGMYCAGITARIAAQLKGSSDIRSVDINLFEQPFQVSLGTLIDLAFLLALLIFLMRRFSLARKEEERLAGEFEAARTIQSLLIPAAPPATPGFAVENVYLPAQEVGGDFFQVLPGEDGSLLIVVGDVSGKGLKAAMTVSLIVGALRTVADTTSQPAEALAGLNRRLHERLRGGFASCIAIRLDSDGNCLIANAGHLPPYRNGEEVALPPGLPLGIVAESEYSEISVQLAPGDRLTFLSDGVVEARNERGDLFGFDRTRAICTQSAEEIARAAQAHGQEDDITVLTLVYLGESSPAHEPVGLELMA